jgi:branched-chain amino acid transport system ATP-binding protein
MTEETNMSTLLEAKSISVSYGKVAAVSGVSVDVKAGQIVTVVGANGAGKTSLLNALMGMIPHDGTINYAGAAIEKSAPQIRFRHGICLVPEQRELFGEMSVGDNLLLGGFVREKREHVRASEAREQIYELFPRLRERAQQHANTLSGGERQMLALGRALMAKPRLLLLDEPSLGLAPLIVAEMFEIISRLRTEGFSILLVEQNARMALRVADYAYVMEQGRIALQGPAKELAGDPKVIAAYLGIKGGKNEEKSLLKT